MVRKCDSMWALLAIVVLLCLLFSGQQTAAVSVSITVTRGCGSTLCIGEHVVTTFQLSENAYIDIWVETSTSSWYNMQNRYFTAGTYSFEGTIASPEGYHTIHIKALTMAGSIAEDSCTYYVECCDEPIPPTSAPPSDKDNDGVSDSSDRCYNPDCSLVDSRGCPKDSDGDKVDDCDDDCKYEEGSASNDGCPESVGDKDNDGIADDRDGCYNPGCRVIDSQGCPKDSDRDGVNDCDDDCLYEKGPASQNGCPKNNPSNILKYWWIIIVLALLLGVVLYLNRRSPPKLKM